MKSPPLISIREIAARLKSERRKALIRALLAKQLRKTRTA